MTKSNKKSNKSRKATKGQPKMTKATKAAHERERTAWEEGIKTFTGLTAQTHSKAPTGPLKERTADSVFSTLTKRQSRLIRMLSYCRPAGSDTEAAFIRHWIDAIPGMKQDSNGNRFIAIGDERPTIAFTAHTDTVHRREGFAAIDYDPATSMIRLAPHSAATCLGADCTTGVFIMLEMIRQAAPGLYLFFRAEEVGCIGSQAMALDNPEILNGIKAAISLDRKGYDEIITHQCSMRTASDAFAISLAAQLSDAHEPSDGGVFTDSNELVDLVGECTNIAVGYHNQHTNRESQHLHFAEALADALAMLDPSDLVFQRKPGEKERLYWGVYSNRQQPTYTQGDDGTYTLHTYEDDYEAMTTLETMTQAVKENPRAIALLLLDYGLDLADIQETIYQHTGYVKFI